MSSRKPKPPRSARCPHTSRSDGFHGGSLALRFREDPQGHPVMTDIPDLVSCCHHACGIQEMFLYSVDRQNRACRLPNTFLTDESEAFTMQVPTATLLFLQMNKLIAELRQSPLRPSRIQRYAGTCWWIPCSLCFHICLQLQKLNGPMSVPLRLWVSSPSK